MKRSYLLFWLIFSGVFGFGLYKIFEVLSNYLALPWLIVVALCILILFLLFAIEAMRLLHNQTLDEWTRHMSVVDSLYDGKVEAERLYIYCKTNHPNIKALVDNWQSFMEARLRKIGEEYKRVFYEDSKGRYVPDLPDTDVQRQEWLRDRISNTKLQ